MKQKNQKIFLIPFVLTLLLSLPSYAQLHMNSSGNIGIGNSAVGYKLKVYGSIYGTSFSGSNFGWSSSNYKGDSFKMYGGSETTWNVMITSDIPGKLHVDGDLIESSDERLKKDKKVIENASDMIRKFSGYSYQFKTNEELRGIDFGGTREYTKDTIYIDGEMVIIDEEDQKAAPRTGKHYGFIAQELEKDFPELVSYDSASGMYGVNYIHVIPILVEANKELLAALDDYEARLQELEGQAERATSSGAENPDEVGALFEQSELFQNAPNPFNEQTRISFTLSDKIKSAALFVYDMRGRQMKRFDINARGHSSITINGGDLEAGIFMYSLIADGQLIGGTKKMILTD